MATNPWALGTDSGEKLRRELQDFIKDWLGDAKYKARLPKQHSHILIEGDKEPAGVIVRIASEPDPKQPWTYALNGHDVTEDYHQIALFVKADKKVGGAASVSAFFGALRSLFANRDGTTERNDLVSRGIHMCFETPEGLIVEPEGNDSEGTFFRMQLNLRCNTDCYLN